MGVAIHTNLSLKHQVQIAEALKRGFQRHGVESVITPDKEAAADIHICLGPWYALERWKYGNTLYIDRAYWGDPECVSLHWLVEGEKARFKGMPERQHPELQPMKEGERRVYLCDYGCSPLGKYHTVRFHPSDRPSRYTLEECLDTHHIAMGRRTTALVTAHIAGLRVETDDPHSPVYGATDRVQWVNDLAWHNWALDEIAAGEAWEVLKY